MASFQTRSRPRLSSSQKTPCFESTSGYFGDHVAKFANPGLACLASDFLSWCVSSCKSECDSLQRLSSLQNFGKIWKILLEEWQKWDLWNFHNTGFNTLLQGSWMILLMWFSPRQVVSRAYAWVNSSLHQPSSILIISSSCTNCSTLDMGQGVQP